MIQKLNKMEQIAKIFKGYQEQVDNMRIDADELFYDLIDDIGATIDDTDERNNFISNCGAIIPEKRDENAIS